MTATLAPAAAALQLLPLAQLHESPLNPRRHFDPAKLEELADSIRKVGIVTPILARPNASGYEIAAGHRRFRAAQLVGLDTAPVVVREMDDVAFLEVLTIENLQREDVHPLEEADGFQSLMTSAGYDVAKLAARVGRSHQYVYDRLRLLGLVEAARELFFAGKFTTGHAVLLARLTPDDQNRAIGDADVTSGLFTSEHLEWSPDEELELDDARKPVSVREFQGWINKHVRFNPAADDVPDLFPETAAVVQQAAEQEEKIIKITHEYTLQPEARDESERTWGPRSWKRADGKKGSKECEYPVTGVVAIGPGRGEAFRVCTEKKKCKTHWADEQRLAAKRAKAVTTSSTSSVDKHRLEQEKRQQEQRRQDAERARYKKAIPALLEALAAAVKKGGASAIADIVLDHCKPDSWSKFKVATAEQLVPVGATAESILRHAAMLIVGELATDEWHGPEDLRPVAKKLGVDLKAVVDRVAPPPAPPPKEKKEPLKKAVAKKTPATKAKAATPKKAATTAKQRVADATATFMKPHQPSEALAAIVGDKPLVRTEVTKKIWAYIKKHGLQDKVQRRQINADEKLKLLFGGKSSVSMFDMTKLINKHLTPVTGR